MTVTIYETHETLSWFDNRTGEVTSVSGSAEQVQLIWKDEGEQQIIERRIERPITRTENW